MLALCSFFTNGFHGNTSLNDDLDHVATIVAVTLNVIFRSFFLLMMELLESDSPTFGSRKDHLLFRVRSNERPKCIMPNL